MLFVISFSMCKIDRFVKRQKRLLHRCSYTHVFILRIAEKYRSRVAELTGKVNAISNILYKL